MCNGCMYADFSERPPTTITSELMHEHAHHLDPETVDLISNRDKSEVRDSRHLPLLRDPFF